MKEKSKYSILDLNTAMIADLMLNNPEKYKAVSIIEKPNDCPKDFNFQIGWKSFYLLSNLKSENANDWNLPLLIKPDPNQIINYKIDYIESKYVSKPIPLSFNFNENGKRVTLKTFREKNI